MLVRTGMFVASAAAQVEPTIASFTLAAPTKASGCQPVQSVASWTITNADNTNFKLVIAETAAEFNCASSPSTTLTGTSGNYTDGAVFSIALTFTLQVVRRVDDSVRSSLQATSVAPNVLVGNSC